MHYELESVSTTAHIIPENISPVSNVICIDEIAGKRPRMQLRIDNKVANFKIYQETTLNQMKSWILSEFSASNIHGLNFYTADGTELAMSSKLSNLMEMPYFQIAIDFQHGT